MSIKLDHQLREQIPHNSVTFPITFFKDELASLPNRTGPLHWHPDFEIATAACNQLEYQVGQQHIILEKGDSIFVNGNMLHGIKQLTGDEPDPMPNIVFSGALAASETSVIYQKYIRPVQECGALPFIVFRHNEPEHQEFHQLLNGIYAALCERETCYEMAVQRYISQLFEYIFKCLDHLPKSEETRIQLAAQIRIQKMLTYIYEHHAETVSLDDIAKAANISRSEAGRCFNTYMNCSPIDYLIRYRLQIAHKLLNETTCTLHEISYNCGFHSVNYFSRQFRKLYGYAPSKNRTSGK